MSKTNESIDKNKPIGIYDSGVGGLSVLMEVSRKLPNEDFIYFGDLKNAPYGTKNQDEIMELSLKCGDFLYEKNVKSIIIACNTATSIVVQTMRNKYNIPIFSMEPAVKPAVDEFGEGIVIVLATPATLAQRRYRTLLNKLGAENRVKNIPCAGLVELIENDKIDSQEMDEYLSNLFFPLRYERNICAIVLGCTHYSFARHSIEKAAIHQLNSNIKIYDGRYGTARYVREYLTSKNLITDSKCVGEITFYSSINNNIDIHLKDYYLNHTLESEE